MSTLIKIRAVAEQVTVAIQEFRELATLPCGRFA
jgi:hypothetical protein